jgi:hypothetical protein
VLLQVASCQRQQCERVKTGALAAWRRAVEHHKQRAALVQACTEARTERFLAATLAALQQAAELSRAAEETASHFAQQRQRQMGPALLALGGYPGKAVFTSKRLKIVAWMLLYRLRVES